MISQRATWDSAWFLPGMHHEWHTVKVSVIFWRKDFYQWCVCTCRLKHNIFLSQFSKIVKISKSKWNVATNALRTYLLKLGNYFFGSFCMSLDCAYCNFTQCFVRRKRHIVRALGNQQYHLCVFSVCKFTPLVLIIDEMNYPEITLWGTIHTE